MRSGDVGTGLCVYMCIYGGVLELQHKPDSCRRKDQLQNARLQEAFRDGKRFRCLTHALRQETCT